MSIETNVVKEKIVNNLKDYCYFAAGADFMSVTEWANGEGFTVAIDTKAMGNRVFQLSWGEWDALIALVSYKGEK